MVVVVGAGASFDSVLPLYERGQEVRAAGLAGWPPNDVRPPLTSDLVSARPFQNELLSRYPACRPVVNELRRRFGGAPQARTSGEAALSLEGALEAYEKRTGVDGTRHRHLIAFRFYLRDLLWACSDYMLSSDLSGGDTNYTTLVGKLYEWAVDTGWHVCYVNFNFDFLLEQACADRWGLRIMDPASYVTATHASVVKPHGSVRWAWRVRDRDPLGNSTVADAEAVRLGEEAMDGLDSRIQAVDRPGYRPIARTTSISVPALALPIANKSQFAWPKEHAAHFRSLAGRVRALVTIGWRGAEHHFLEELGSLLAPTTRVLLVTGGPTADEDAIQIWTNVAEGSTAGIAGAMQSGGFSEFMRGTELESFLDEVAKVRNA